MMPMAVNDIDMAFGGAGKMKDLLPSWAQIPKEFQDELDPFSPLVNKWFFSGLSKDAIKVKPGIDEKAAFRHLKTIMGSFEPKHEHKIAGVAYLMSRWFDLAGSAPKTEGK